MTASSRPRPLLRTMLGDVLRRTRLEQGRTLADVARAARVSMPYLSEVERGRKEVSSEILAAICDALRIDLADLLAEVGSDLAGAARRARPRLPASGSGPSTSRRPRAGAGSRRRTGLLARRPAGARDPQALSSSAGLSSPAGTALRLSMTSSASP